MFPTYVDSSLLTEDVFYIGDSREIPVDRVDLTDIIGYGLRALASAGKRRVLGFMQKGLATSEADCPGTPMSPYVEEPVTLSPTFDPSPFVFGIRPADSNPECNRTTYDHPYCSVLYASPLSLSDHPLSSEESAIISDYEAPKSAGLGLHGVDASSSNGSIVTEEQLRAEEKKKYLGIPGWFRRAPSSSKGGNLLVIGDDDSEENQALECVRRWSSAWSIDIGCGPEYIVTPRK